ncbi:MAG: hypothetical protein ABSH33_07980 [Steroidobacteraceae bacterium]|jgi:hypothetical protein
MSDHHSILGTVLVLAAFGHGARAEQCSFSLDQSMSLRGSSVTLSVANGPAAGAVPTVTLTHGNQSSKLDGASFTSAGGDAKGQVSATIAESVALGANAVDLEFGGSLCRPADSKQRLNIVPRGNTTVQLVKFDPAYSDVRQYALFSSPGIAEPNAPPVNVRIASLVLRGQGFQPAATDNVIYVNAVPLSVVAGDCATIGSRDHPATPGKVVEQVISDQEIDLCMVPIPATGRFLVRVAVGEQKSDSQSFRVYDLGKTSVALMAGVIALILALIPLVLLTFVKAGYRIADQSYKLRMLFLDPETDTYSLSKLQFYLWTVAALFSYAYLFISRVKIQDGNWPDIPDNLPGVIAIAAGTTVSSLFITASKGSKGAGPMQPGFADFITSGGVVAPDRVQMLLWTLLGVGAFIVAALGQPPAEIQNLPTVPPNLLYMMGLSSAGYLGGKLARKAGPVINEIYVTPADPDDAIVEAAASAVAGGPDFSEAIAGAQKGVTSGGAPINSHAQAVWAAVSNALSATRTAANTAAFTDLLATLDELRQHADSEAQAAVQDFAAGQAVAADAASAQSGAAALQELYAGVTQAIAQSAAFNMREALEIPRIARTITIRGTNMSAEAMLQIDGADLPFRMLQSSDGKQSPDIAVREDGNPTFARVLRLNLDPATFEESDLEQFNAWFGTKGVHMFSLTNPDGQMAEEALPIPRDAPPKSGAAP